MSCGIYKFQNNITNEVYIGQSVNLEDRYKHHQRDWLNGTTNFYKAIQKWGWNNFFYEILEFCSKEDLNEKEKYWIAYYDSFNNGYNETRGGSNKESVNVNENEIYELYKQGFSPKEIQNQMNIALSTVYKYLSCLPQFQENKNIKNDQLFQYDLFGNFIQSWKNQEEIEKILHIDASSIGKVLSGKRVSAGGYYWSNIKKDFFIPDKTANASRIIQQYDLNNNFINEFSSLKEAAKAVNKTDGSLISKVCKNKRTTAYGYKWKYKE